LRRTAGFQRILGVLTLRASVAPTYSMSDLVAVSLAAGVVAVWAESAGGAFSLLALLSCEAAFLAFYLVGSLFAGWRGLATGVLFDLPLRLLVGYAVVNTTLFALVWVSPLGIVANFGAVLGVALLLFLVARPTRESGREGTVGLLALFLSLIAATLWCQDSIRPISAEGDLVVAKPWMDGFYHAIHIRIFGSSHGWGSIEDFRLAGVPARLYHYGIYPTPAFIWRASGIHSYTAFAGILAPMGVFFTGLGAYALAGSLWGRWPGFAACAASLLLPDGVQQGMQNTFMSYHWLTQISPSATYGLALLAVAWLFVLRGSAQGRWPQLLVGWLVAGILVVYKLHLFVASALLLWLLPPLFFRMGRGGNDARAPVVSDARACLGSTSEPKPLRARWRALWAASAVVVYLAAMLGVQKIPGIPPIRLDGSSVREILKLVNSFTPPGGLRDFLADRIGMGHSLGSNLLYGVPFILLAALGLFVPLLVLLAIRLRKRTSLLVLAFPFLLVANFLVMFFGLALDFSRSTPDELSHRPVIVLHFLIVAWIGGAAGLSLVESRRLGRTARPGMVALAVFLMAIPAYLGAGVHRMWAMPMFSPLRIPAGLYRAAEHMRKHGSARDVFQDSELDRAYVVAAVSEKRAYASRSMTMISHNSEKVEERAEAVEEFRKLRDPAAVLAFARKLGIRWFLLSPGGRIDWPEEISGRPAFESGGYRLYRF
jgi:hypothetical protein